MSFSVELLPDEPVLLVTFHQDLDFGSDLPALSEQCNAVLDAASEPLYLVTDALGRTYSVSDLMSGASAATRGETPPFLHPNVRKVVWVTDSKLLELGAKGMSSPIFGSLEIEIFSTLEEALAYCRSGA